jgi:hypothetical protein
MVSLYEEKMGWGLAGLSSLRALLELRSVITSATTYCRLYSLWTSFGQAVELGSASARKHKGMDFHSGAGLNSSTRRRYKGLTGRTTGLRQTKSRPCGTRQAWTGRLPSLHGPSGDSSSDPRVPWAWGLAPSV